VLIGKLIQNKKTPANCLYTSSRKRPVQKIAQQNEWANRAKKTNTDPSKTEPPETCTRIYIYMKGIVDV
jgi:hypothetical protein